MHERPPIVLPWERLLWSDRSHLPHANSPRPSYLLTDLRLIRLDGGESDPASAIDEVALGDIVDVLRTESPLERLLGLSTLVVRTTRPRGDLRLPGVRRGAQLAALLELVSAEVPDIQSLDHDAVRAALAWDPRHRRGRRGEVAAGVLALGIAVGALFFGFHKSGTALAFAADDPIVLADGTHRSRADIVRFMEREVMPWARQTLAPLKGGANHVTCQTCHGGDAEAHGWRMPAVAALPEPDLRRRGWERYGGEMDAQIRNAIYGYQAEADKQARAGYMRETVMPGMAQLLHRPPYDFTQPYDYNRSHQAFGCYHCHKVK